MPELLTLQDLANGHLDVEALGEAANGDENTIVTTRTGNTYPSAKKAISEGITNLFENGGLPAKPFPTLAKMQTEGASLADGSYAMVTDEQGVNVTNNGLYVKASGVWVKSAYDPLTLAKADADNKVKALSDKTATQIDHIASDSLAELKDANGLVVLRVGSGGELFLSKLGETVQEALNRASNSLGVNTNGNIVEVNDNAGNTVLKIDDSGNIFAAGLSDSLQTYALNSSKEVASQQVSVVGEHIVGKSLYAELPSGFVATSYQWLKDNKAIEGATNRSYTLKTTDLFSAITVTVSGVSGGYEVFDKSGTTIGGVAIGEAGKVGTLYEGYVLSAGDDFNELDIIAPHKPLGKWFTTRSYLAGARGSDTLLGTMYDTDPYHVGYNDSNRGVPVGYDNMFVKDSVITLNARVANAYERSHMQGNRNEVASMINSIGAFSMYAGAANGGENILEFRVRHSHKSINPNGWHPSLWTQSSLPSVTYNSNEWDISEGTNVDSSTNYNEWGANGSRTDGNTYGRFSIFDGLWHTVTAIFSHTSFKLYIDGIFDKEIIKDTNSFNEPAYALVSNHIYNGQFGSTTYSKAEWDALQKGATQEVDFIRLWRRAGKSHIKPLVTVPPINIAYGETGAITLPSKMALWGREDVLEHVQTVMTEENEPAGHHTDAYNSLPSFITYDNLTRTATINTANQKSGRLNFVFYGYLQDGSTCEPARTYANVAPRIDITVINMTANASYDLYAKCDCGVLVTDGVKRTKVITVTGLPAGTAYNDRTGLISTSNADAGTSAITIQCINSVGQSTTKTINLIIA